MGTWWAQNKTLQPADNQAPTTTKLQRDKILWEATWTENWTQPPDKQGRHVGKWNIHTIVHLCHHIVDPNPLSLELSIPAPAITISP